MKTYSYIVFDIDGTLIDSSKRVLLSLQETVRQVKGVLMPIEDLKFGFGIPGVRVMEILECEDPVYGQRLWMKNQDVFAKTVDAPLFDGMREVLDALKDGGIKLGIITSRVRDEYDERFEELGIIDYFPVVVTASDTERGKPFADPMLKFLEMSGASAAEVLYFGDTAYDMDCSLAAGVDCALALWGCMVPDGIDATYRVEKVEDILSFVDI